MRPGPGLRAHDLINSLLGMFGPGDIDGFLDLHGLVFGYYGVLVYRFFILLDTDPLFFQDTDSLDMTDQDFLDFRYDPVARVRLPLGGSRSRQSPRPWRRGVGALARLPAWGGGAAEALRWTAAAAQWPAWHGAGTAVARHCGGGCDTAADAEGCGG